MAHKEPCHTIDEDLKRRKLMVLMELSYIEMNIVNGFTKEAVAEIVAITCNINNRLSIHAAIEVQRAGLATRYIAEPNIRELADMWFNSNQYAGLSLVEFVTATGTNVSA
jgi:hypothetical protein